MTEEKLVPELRFPEFEDEWKEKKLKEIVIRVSRKNGEEEVDHILTISGQDGLIDQKKYFKHRVASKNLSNYYRIYKNEFAYNKSYSNGYPYGAIKRLNNYRSGVLSSLYICFKVIEDKTNIDYLKSYFESDKWYKEIYKIAVEGARNHGLLNIGLVDFFNTAHRIPSIKEQEKIGKFFYKIDKKIKLQENLIENLEKQKKGLMQRFFNQEIRLKDENGENHSEWETKKIKEIAEVKTGNTPPTKDPANYGEEYFFVSPADLGEGKYILDTGKRLSKKGFNISRKFPKGSVLFTCIGSTIGKLGIAKEELTSNQQINAILPNNKYNSEYLYYILYFLADRIKLIASNQAVPLINKTEFEKIKIEIPSTTEQNKIANILSLKDKKINLEKEKLENYKEYKKGLMQRVFI